jgi:predicted nucleic acid-binding protein
MNEQRIEIVNPTRLFDSYALLAYLNEEAGYEMVRDLLSTAQDSGNFILMNEINVGETYYILFRERGPKESDYFLETILNSLPIVMVANDFQHVIEAARIKAEYPLSFADCFAVATACREKTSVITGDPEFKKVEHMIQIEWIT